MIERMETRYWWKNNVVFSTRGRLNHFFGNIPLVFRKRSFLFWFFCATNAVPESLSITKSSSSSITKTNMKPKSGAEVVDAGFSLDGNKMFSEKKHNGRQGCNFFFLFSFTNRRERRAALHKRLAKGGFAHSNRCAIYSDCW